MFFYIKKNKNLQRSFDFTLIREKSASRRYYTNKFLSKCRNNIQCIYIYLIKYVCNSMHMYALTKKIPGHCSYGA